MKILKFGGTSVGTPGNIRLLTDILKKEYAKSGRFGVVFSAFSKVTDGLLSLAAKAEVADREYLSELEALKKRHFDAIEDLLNGNYKTAATAQIEAHFAELSDVLHGIFLIGEASPRVMDFVVSFGERNSAFIISQYMQQSGLPTSFLDARQVVRTNSEFGAAVVDLKMTNQLVQQHFKENPNCHAVTGFIGSNAKGHTTTLGRGGSDYTAALFGAALGAEAIEIWTDVDGVLTADPRRVKKAFTLPKVTYREAMEMSHFGAKVIYPPTILPALEQKIPLFIKNTFNPEFHGTLISEVADDKEHPIKGISSISSTALLTLQGSGLFGVLGVAARLFGAMAREGINIILITQASSEYSISFAVAPKDAERAKRAADAEFEREIEKHKIEPLKVETDLSIIAVVGEGMRYRPGISGQLFSALGKNGVNIVAVAQGSSELNISMVIPSADESKALNAIHEGFFLSDTKTLHIFMVGVGLIGGTFLKQVQQHADFLRKNRKIELKIVGLANSRKMVFEEEGIDLGDWKERLSNEETPFSMPNFVQQMKAFNVSNAIFIDNTASQSVANFYEQILQASISISTPNKLAASGPYLQYRRLKEVAELRNVRWRYETNVGAGLPLITTLNDLIQSGDRILKIEGVLSGSLSFIFNNFKAGMSFSDIVKKAKAAGYTEPDPRDDLSGADVRRKLLILSRESGLEMESEAIDIQSILPKACIEAESVNAFFTALEANDAYFETMRKTAETEGKVLRMVAKLEGTSASIALQSVDQNHPFYSLNGSDNMVVFTTDRYKERPLVVRGPGAGAEVTAAGVFAEVIGMVR